MNNHPGSCEECPKYKSCTDLCEESQLWVDQDYIGRNSNLVLENGGQYHGSAYNTSGWDVFLDLVKFTKGDSHIEMDSDTSQDAWMEVSSMRLSDKVVRFIYSYYMLGKRIRDIAIDEKATSQAIDQRRLQAKRSVAGHLKRRSEWIQIREKLEFKNIAHYDIACLFFRDGYPRRSIAKMMGLHSSTVIKIIGNQNKVLGLSKKVFTLCA